MSNRNVGHFINGQIVEDSGRTQEVFNPATGRAVRQVALASKATVEEAIAAAQAAFPAMAQYAAIETGAHHVPFQGIAGTEPGPGGRTDYRGTRQGAA